MKTLFTALTTTLALTALVGCSATPGSVDTVAAGTVQGTTGALGVIPQEREITMMGQLNIKGPGGYTVQALTAWNLGDVDHVKLTLSKGGTTVSTKVIARSALTQPVTLNNLRMSTTYKILAQAYSDAAETVQIDNTTEASSDAANSVTFTTPALVTATAGDNVDDVSRTIAIPVRLKNKTFAGQAAASTGVNVTNGTIVNTQNNETF